MAHRGEPDLGPLFVFGTIALGVGTVWAILRPRSASASADAPAPPVVPQPAGQLPIAPSAPEAATASVDPATESTIFASRPPYGMVLYTSRWTGTEWGPWDGPTWHRGVRSLDTLSWQSSEEAMDDYLDAISSTNQNPGYWMAYRLDVKSETPDGTPTEYGGAGAWIAGRFGDVKGINGGRVAMYGPFGLSPGGAGTHWWG